MAAVLLLPAAAALAGCSSGSMIGDHMPTAIGGLPQDAPAPPAVPPAYPAVHDMPPPRADTMLNYAQQKLLADDLIAVRNRYGGAPAASSSAPAASSSSTANSAPGSANNP